MHFLSAGWIDGALRNAVSATVRNSVRRKLSLDIQRAGEAGSGRAKLKTIRAIRTARVLILQIDQ